MIAKAFRDPLKQGNPYLQDMGVSSSREPPKRWLSFWFALKDTLMGIFFQLSASDMGVSEVTVFLQGWPFGHCPGFLQSASPSARGPVQAQTQVGKPASGMVHVLCPVPMAFLPASLLQAQFFIASPTDKVFLLFACNPFGLMHSPDDANKVIVVFHWCPAP